MSNPHYLKIFSRPQMHHIKASAGFLSALSYFLGSASKNASSHYRQTGIIAEAYLCQLTSSFPFSLPHSAPHPFFWCISYIYLRVLTQHMLEPSSMSVQAQSQQGARGRDNTTDFFFFFYQGSNPYYKLQQFNSNQFKNPIISSFAQFTWVYQHKIE